MKRFLSIFILLFSHALFAEDAVQSKERKSRISLQISSGLSPVAVGGLVAWLFVSRHDAPHAKIVFLGVSLGGNLAYFYQLSEEWTVQTLSSGLITILFG